MRSASAAWVFRPASVNARVSLILEALTPRRRLRDSGSVM